MVGGRVIGWVGRWWKEVSKWNNSQVGLRRAGWGRAGRRRVS